MIDLFISETLAFFFNLFCLFLLHKSERLIVHVVLNWCVCHLVLPFQGSAEICNIQMHLDYVQADLEVWPSPASNSDFWRMSPLSLCTPILLFSSMWIFVFLNWVECFTFSSLKSSAPLISFKFVSLLQWNSSREEVCRAVNH